jgi:hypothetical protein
MPSTRRSAATLLAALTLTLPLAGCDKRIAGALREVAAKKSPPIDPFAADVVAQGARDLEARLGTAVMALDVEVTPRRVSFEVQDPTKAQNVDVYEVRNGVLLDPQPVQLIGEGDVSASAYPLAQIRLERIPSFAREAVAALAFEDGKVTSLRIHRKNSGIPASVQKALEDSRRRMGIASPQPAIAEGQIQIEVYVDSPRRKGYVLANADFEIVRTDVL